MALVIFVGYLLQFGLFANSPLIDTVPNILLIITVSFGFMKGKIREWPSALPVGCFWILYP